MIALATLFTLAAVVSMVLRLLTRRYIVRKVGASDWFGMLGLVFAAVLAGWTCKLIEVAEDSQFNRMPSEEFVLYLWQVR